MADGLVHSGHRRRVRRKYIKNGLDVFNDHEVLEFLLYYCYPRRDTNTKAHNMINEFGSLTNLMESSVEEIMRRCNVTETVAVLISLTPHLARRYASGKWAERAVLDSVRKVSEYAKTLFIGRTTENFYLICLDAQRRLIYPALISEGSMTDTAIYPRKIVEEALKHQACSVVLAHNHPSGTVRPSQNDQDATFVIGRTLAQIDIELLDHIVVAGEKTYSFSEGGKLDTVY